MNLGQCVGQLLRAGDPASLATFCSFESTSTRNGIAIASYFSATPTATGSSPFVRSTFSSTKRASCPFTSGSSIVRSNIDLQGAAQSAQKTTNIGFFARLASATACGSSVSHTPTVAGSAGAFRGIATDDV